MSNVESELQSAFPQLKTNEPLAPYSTFRIGGPADFFLIAKTQEKLKKAYLLAHNAKLPLFILGGGSNVLFADEGFRGLVIKNAANKIAINDEEITADSGTLWAQVIQKAIEQNLKGIEQLVGLPGTLGAAVRGNAGAHGVEMKDILKSARLINAQTQEEKEVTPDYFQFDYRESKLKTEPELVLEVTLKLQKNTGTPDDLRAVMKQLLLERREKQPTGKNAGSFFKNPSKEISAGRLIDEAGLKGSREGDAQISPMHGNFFMNTGQASQKQMILLAKKAAEKVEEMANISLKQEVCVVDDYGIPIQLTC